MSSYEHVYSPKMVDERQRKLYTTDAKSEKVGTHMQKIKSNQYTQ